MSRYLLLLAIGCGSPKLPYWSVRDNAATWTQPRERDDLTDGTCTAKLRVRVVDVAGKPIAGAEVIAQRRQRLNAPSTVPVTLAYQSKVVRTNERGEAVTCSPDDIPKTQDMFGTFRDSRVHARHGALVGSLDAPFTGSLVLR